MIDHGEDLQYGFFFGAMLLFGITERLWPRRGGSQERRQRWPTNWAMTVIAVLSLSLIPIGFIGAAIWAERNGVGLLNVIALPGWVVIVVTLLVRGFISTGTHWLNHKVPWLWRIHRVHHLDTQLDISTTVRLHPLEFFVGAFIGVPIVIACGLPAWILAFYELLDVTVTLFSHSNTRLPRGVDRWLRYLIVTPDLHRVHHSSWQPETDSNYGAVFPIWDMILGTYVAQPRQPHESMQLGLAEHRGDEVQRVGSLLYSPLRPNPWTPM